jgi:glycosyltransferase involved in cell wall biosynthesis
MTTPDHPVRLSVVVPVRNEEGNVEPLINEIVAACQSVGAYEVIYVDDGSTDQTLQRLQALKAQLPMLRVLRHQSSCGQSAAVRSGVKVASGRVIATLDGDGQNNPAYIPQMLWQIESNDKIGMVAGQRIGRKDTGFKRWQSRTANRVRAWVLKDSTRDTGCGLKAIKRDVYLALPYFDALHRFMPALVVREGYLVSHVDVTDRPRYTGVSNYGFFDRLWVGIKDLIGVAWLISRRRKIPAVTEIV